MSKRVPNIENIDVCTLYIDVKIEELCTSRTENRDMKIAPVSTPTLNIAIN